MLNTKTGYIKLVCVKLIKTDREREIVPETDVKSKRSIEHNIRFCK